jgi:hypothetical protein
MKANSMRKFKTLALLASALVAIWACNLGGEAKTEEVFTFPALADSLKGSDRALIYLTDASGDAIDTLFNGPITPATRFENLVARRYDGGKVNVVIEGYKDGAVYYKIQKNYDGANSKVDETIIVIARPVVPGPGVTPLPESVRITATNPLILTVGGPSISLTADVLPVDAAQTIVWSLPSNDIAVLEAGNKIKGLKAGTVQAKASSVMASQVFSYLDVTVNPAPSVLPTSITPKDTALTLTVGAASVPLEATIQPDEASQGLIWSLDPPGVAVAEIVNGSHIRGLKAGTINAIATSLVKSEVTASIKITVVVSVVVAESILLGMPTPRTAP